MIGYIRTFLLKQYCRDNGRLLYKFLFKTKNTYSYLTDERKVSITVKIQIVKRYNWYFPQIYYIIACLFENNNFRNNVIIVVHHYIEIKPLNTRNDFKQTTRLAARNCTYT